MSKVRVSILIGALFVLVISVLYYLHYRKTHITTDNAYVEGRIHIISSKVPGTVKAVYVEDNRLVKKGDVLLEIDEKDYDYKVKEAEAAYEIEKRRLTEIESNVLILKQKLSEIDAAIEAEKAQMEVQTYLMEQARIDYERAENLFKKEAIPKERYEKALTSYNVSRTTLKAIKERIKQLEAQRETLLLQIEQLNNTVKTQKAAILLREATLGEAKLKKSYAKIVAPADGYVTKKSVEKGNQIQPGQPLMALVSLDDLWVVANYKETQIENIKPGQKVKIKVDSYPGIVFEGKVDSIMAGTGASFSLFPPENATGNWVKVVQRIPVKIVFDEDPKKKALLRIGMSCVPTIIVK
ncbi:MAG: HlyD family secretion protein [Deltaproteobacteria bacterium]|nr:HlyD family secretion protein [Deltaproteobacteria bacterium]